ncbi:MAG TPA: trypsin-like peptidase domain-containing protein [Thermoanaerobaculia bacterium]|nr:trypsin-like peptidase domain-containing protein [Thermoanaerobaculia bacterium]
MRGRGLCEEWEEPLTLALSPRGGERGLRGRFLVLLFFFLATFCRRDVSRLDDVQKMAYGVKPAVVRISALATADFRYPVSAIAKIESQIKLRARDVAAAEGVVETGAGGSGSGFIIHPDGFILTSGHVVAPTQNQTDLERDLRRNGAIAALVKHFPVDELRTLYRGDELDRYVDLLAAEGRVVDVRVVNRVELSNGEALPFTIRRFSPELGKGGTDLAVLKIDRKGLPSLSLGDSETTRIGESIWSIGYPAVASSSDDVIGGWLSRDSDLEATVNPGTITAIKRNVANTPVFQSNVAIYRGNSGGPAVNRNGEAIGVSTWGHTNAEQIKFLVPINVARQLLAEAKLPASSDGEFNQKYRAALEAAYDGRWIDAKKDLVRATGLFPNSPDLIRFGRDAERAIASMPPWKLYPAATWAFAGVLLISAAWAASTVFRSRTPMRAFAADVLKAPTVETVVAPNGTTSSQSMLGKFTILNGTRAGEKLGLGGSGIRIGRESTICEIVLENPKVSRLHAEVVSIDGKVLLIDRNSSNGTYVNDQKIDKRFLQDGDIIYFGGRNAVAVAFHA